MSCENCTCKAPVIGKAMLVLWTGVVVGVIAVLLTVFAPQTAPHAEIAIRGLGTLGGGLVILGLVAEFFSYMDAQVAAAKKERQKEKP